jgi:hypothetical protein
MTRNGRVTKLEEKVFQPPEHGTSKLCICELPDAERALLKVTQGLVDRQGELTEQQKKLIRTSTKRLAWRSIDIFTTFLELWMCHGDHHARLTMESRFMWFMEELRKEMKIQLRASEIEREHADDENQDVDHVDEYFHTVPDTFTEESYDKLEHELDMEWFKEHREEIDAWLEKQKRGGKHVRQKQV